MRAFLAIPVRPPALDDLMAVRDGLAAAVGAVRWARGDSAHITLHFFGGIDAEGADRVTAALRPTMAAAKAMALRLGGLGSFPCGGARPRVLWLGVEGDVPRLAELAAACRATLSAIGLPVDDCSHRPHCTLGRPRQPWPATCLAEWREAAHARPATSWFSADRAILYESLPTPTGTRHVPRTILPFG